MDQCVRRKFFANLATIKIEFALCPCVVEEWDLNFTNRGSNKVYSEIVSCAQVDFVQQLTVHFSINGERLKMRNCNKLSTFVAYHNVICLMQSG